MTNIVNVIIDHVLPCSYSAIICLCVIPICTRLWGCLMFFQSINENLYSAPSRSLLRGAPDVGQMEKNSLEKVVELRIGTVWEVPYKYLLEVHSRLLDQPQKRTGLHCRKAGEWDHQIAMDRELQCTTACTRRELVQIGGRPARQAPPHQGCDSVWDVLCEWKPMQYIPQILGYVVKLFEPANKSCRSPVDPPQLLQQRWNCNSEASSLCFNQSACHRMNCSQMLQCLDACIFKLIMSLFK